MKVGINALYLLPGKVGGSEIYVRNLVRTLPEAAPANEYFVFINRESEGVFDSGKVKVVRCGVRAEKRPLRILYEQTVLPLRARMLGLDCLISAGMTGPFLPTVPSFVMVYDLQHINQPENFSPGYLIFLRAIIRRSARSADCVLTLSERSKRDIVRHYAIPPERVAVTYLASDAKTFRQRSPSECESVRRKYGLPARYVLYIASSLPHKNYERLLAAFKSVNAKTGARLVLIGARDYGHGAIREKIAALGLEEEVVFLGWLPFEDIPVIYSAAELFVFPSLHEGFGIPVLEAMASGVPVVCSKIEPLDEVAGKAACFVDPLSVESIAGGMLRVLEDGALRERLVSEGFRRAAEFSWERTAADTLEAVSRHLPKAKGAWASSRG